MPPSRKPLLRQNLEGSFHLLNVSYAKRTGFTDGLIYSALPESKESNLSPHISFDPSLLAQNKVNYEMRHTFPPGPEWAPEKLEINGRKGRRIVCVLAKDKKNYRVYDIEAADDFDEIMAE
jgi:anaphase-promoting complex subunit 4